MTQYLKDIDNYNKEHHDIDRVKISENGSNGENGGSGSGQAIHSNMAYVDSNNGNGSKDLTMP